MNSIGFLPIHPGHILISYVKLLIFFHVFNVSFPQGSVFSHCAHPRWSQSCQWFNYKCPISTNIFWLILCTPDLCKELANKISQKFLKLSITQPLHPASREDRYHASRLHLNLEMEKEAEPLCPWAPELPWVLCSWQDGGVWAQPSQGEVRGADRVGTLSQCDSPFGSTKKATKATKPLKSLRPWELIGAEHIWGITQIGSDSGTMVGGLSFNINLSSSRLEVLKIYSPQIASVILSKMKFDYITPGKNCSVFLWGGAPKNWNYIPQGRPLVV